MLVRLLCYCFPNELSISMKFSICFDVSWIPASHFLIGKPKKRSLRKRRPSSSRPRRRVSVFASKPRLSIEERFALVAKLRLAINSRGSDSLFQDLGLDSEVERVLHHNFPLDKTFFKSRSYYLSQKELNALQHALNGNILTFLSLAMTMLFKTAVPGAVLWAMSFGDIVLTFFSLAGVLDYHGPSVGLDLLRSGSDIVTSAIILFQAGARAMMMLDRSVGVMRLFVWLFKATRWLPSSIRRRLPTFLSFVFVVLFTLSVSFSFTVCYLYFVYFPIYILIFGFSAFLSLTFVFFTFCAGLATFYLIYAVFALDVLSELSAALALNTVAQIIEILGGGILKPISLINSLFPRRFFILVRILSFPLLFPFYFVVGPFRALSYTIRSFVWFFRFVRLLDTTPFAVVVSDGPLLGRILLTGYYIFAETWIGEAVEEYPRLATWFYPVTLLAFAWHHFQAIPWRRPDASIDGRIHPHTLALRLFISGLSPLLALFSPTFIVSLLGVFYTFPLIFGAYLGFDISLYFLWVTFSPISVMTWCQTAFIRIKLQAGEADLQGRFTAPLRAFCKVWVNLYLHSMRPSDSLEVTDNPIAFSYFDEVGGKCYFHFRDDVPDTDQIFSMFLGTFRSVNPEYQHFLLGLFFLAVPILILIYILRSFVNYTYFVIARYLKRLLVWNVAIWLLPDFILAPGVGAFTLVSLKIKAFLDNFSFKRDVLPFIGLLWFSTMTDKEIRNPFSNLAYFKTFKLDPASRVRYLTAVRSSQIRLARRLDEFRLPEFVESQWQAPSVETIRDTYQRLKDMGFPVLQTFIDSIRGPEDSPYLQTWGDVSSHVVALTDHVLGVVSRRVSIPEEMGPWQGWTYFGKNFAGYIHVAFYNTIETEIQSTKRYWTGQSEVPDFPPELKADLLDGVWEGVKAQFASSSLAEPEVIFRKWEKRFNMGFGFEKGFNREGRPRLVKRFEAIAKFGSRKEFLAAWKAVFREAPSMVPVAPVFAKMETLKLKKYVARAVRTVIGSSFTHHVMTTAFNFHPNHNYKIWDTPFKVGMSFNGINFGRLWDDAQTHSLVFAGDMTAFDSSLPPVIVKLVAEVRKIGFKDHADYHKICQLIDVAYDQLLDHPLGMRATGEVLVKKQGLTTGHSSTTPDNSISLLICYLYAWRRVTGRRTREFFNHNKLFNYSDDHGLSYEEVYGWTPERAMTAMAELGVVMRNEAPNVVSLPGRLPDEATLRRRFSQIKPDLDFDRWVVAHTNLLRQRGIAVKPDSEYKSLFERLKPKATFEQWHEAVLEVEANPSLSKFSFLSKVPVPVTGKIKADLDRAGIYLPYRYATLHDPERLIGKIKGQMFSNIHPLVRRQRLVSYMDLCAHHEDVYEMLLMSIKHIEKKYESVWRRSGEWNALIKYPSYVDVLRKWYNDKSNVRPTNFDMQQDDEGTSEFLDDLILLSVAPSISDTLVRWLADFPTIFAPRRVGMFWTEWIVHRIPFMFDWPLQLLALSNHLPTGSMGVRDLCESLPYRVIVNSSTLVPRPSPPLSVLMVRHWIFNYIWINFLSKKRQSSWFDVLNLLDKAIAEWHFIIFARPILTVRNFDFQPLTLLVIFILNFINLDVPYLTRLATYLNQMSVPSLSLIIDSLWFELRRFLNPLGAVDRQPFIAEIQSRIARGGGSIVSAPTGAGKSTTLVAAAARATGSQFVVIVPRLKVATSLVAWMKKINPDLTIGGAGEGLTHKADDQIIYSTPLAALGQTLYSSVGRRVVILDEAHVDEPLYHVLLSVIRRGGRGSAPYILMTATPGSNWTEPLVEIPSAPRFTVNTLDHVADSLKKYYVGVADILGSLLPHNRVLVFLPSKMLCDEFASRFPNSVVMYSGSEEIGDKPFRHVFSTNVADAGITIPDVDVVISSDVDVFVSVRRNARAQNDEGLRFTRTFNYFRLSPQTIRQRRGRTGRTVDGTFHLFSVTGANLVNREFSHQDYLDNLGSLTGRFVEHVEGLLDFVRQNMVTNKPIGEDWVSQITSTWASQLGDLVGMNRAVTASETLQSFGPDQTREIIYLAEFELPPPESIQVPFNPEDGIDMKEVESIVESHPISNWQYVDPETLEPSWNPAVPFPAQWGFKLSDVAQLGRDYAQLGINPFVLLHFALFSKGSKMEKNFYKSWKTWPKGRAVKTLTDQWWDTISLIERTSFQQRKIEISKSSTKGKEKAPPAPERLFTVEELVKNWCVTDRYFTLLVRSLGVSVAWLLDVWRYEPEHPFFNTDIIEFIGTHEDVEIGDLIALVFPSYRMPE